jgi:putative addiction module component (TIGR02574 family)
METYNRIVYLLDKGEDRMSEMLAELKKKASQLSDAERAELALSLIESLDGPADPDVEEAWRIEIERRIGQIDRGEVQLIPGDEVFARLRRRLG